MLFLITLILVLLLSAILHISIRNYHATKQANNHKYNLRRLETLMNLSQRMNDLERENAYLSALIRTTCESVNNFYNPKIKTAKTTKTKEKVDVVWPDYLKPINLNKDEEK